MKKKKVVPKRVTIPPCPYCGEGIVVPTHREVTRQEYGSEKEFQITYQCYYCGADFDVKYSRWG